LVLVLALWVTAAAGAAGPSPAFRTEAEFARIVEETAEAVETLRGWKFKSPIEKAFIEQEGLREHVEERFEKQYPEGKFERVQAFLRMVGLVPPDCDVKETFTKAVLAQALGFYDPESRTFYVIRSKGQTYGKGVLRLILAHELTHALDHQYFDLTQFTDVPERTEDRELALWSVVEGSATNVMTRYMQQEQAAGRFDIGELMAYSQAEAERTEKLLRESPPYMWTIIGVYTCGMNFLLRGQFMAAAMGGGRSVGPELLAAAKSPPASTEQVLHPAKYWDKTRLDAPVVVDDAAAGKLLAGPGRTVLHADTVGEMLCAVLARPKGQKPNPMMMGLPPYWTNDAAAGWGGDRFYLLGPASAVGPKGEVHGDVKGVWITAWDTPADRDAFVATQASATPLEGRASAKMGNLGAVFFYGFPAAERQALLEKLTDSPPPLRRGEKAWSFWVP
jgi:hypothetical protein